MIRELSSGNQRCSRNHLSFPIQIRIFVMNQIWRIADLACFIALDGVGRAMGVAVGRGDCARWASEV